MKSAGGVAVGDMQANPAVWLPDKGWGELGRMSDLETAKGFKDDFLKLESQWKVETPRTPHLCR